MTNNLDLHTRDHVIQVLHDYPGAMLIISHDVDFLAAIGVSDSYHLNAEGLPLPKVLQGSSRNPMCWEELIRLFLLPHEGNGAEYQ